MLTTHGLSFFECIFLDMRNTAMPDERAVMTYVSSYYHCFSGAQKVCVLQFELIYNKRVEYLCARYRNMSLTHAAKKFRFNISQISYLHF